MAGRPFPFLPYPAYWVRVHSPVFGGREVGKACTELHVTLASLLVLPPVSMSSGNFCRIFCTALKNNLKVLGGRTCSGGLRPLQRFHSIIIVRDFETTPCGSSAISLRKLSGGRMCALVER